MIFLNSPSSAAVLVMFDLPSGGQSIKSSVDTLTPREAKFGKIIEKTQYLTNTLYKASLVLII